MRAGVTALGPRHFGRRADCLPAAAPSVLGLLCNVHRGTLTILVHSTASRWLCMLWAPGWTLARWILFLYMALLHCNPGWSFASFSNFVGVLRFVSHLLQVGFFHDLLHLPFIEAG
jgi:hypothetical protein